MLDSTWTLKTIRDRMRIVIGLHDEEALPNAYLDHYINSCLRFALPYVLNAPELRRRFQLTTANGQAQYGIDPDMMSIVGPVYIGDELMTHTFNDAWFFGELKRFDISKTGKPHTVLFFEAQMFLHPEPDDSYQITTVALGRPPVLENDDDTVFKQSWGLPVVYGAAMEYARDTGDIETAGIVSEKFEYAVGLARREELYHYNDRRAAPRF